MKPFFFSFLIAFTVYTSFAQVKPVTPNASPEAAELLKYLYTVIGKNTLSGQHNHPLLKDAYYQQVYELTHEHPAIFSQDIGFGEPNTLYGINYRQRIVDDAIAKNKEGAIIAITWQAAPPMMEEPVSYNEGVQRKLTEKEWKDIITPGTELNERWKSQVDVLAFFLKQLCDVNVPVLWRPYYEMNAAWFWWGQKKGEQGYKKLYTMLFDRLVKYHNINNLIWVFNADIDPKNDAYEQYFPGSQYIDVLAVNNLQSDFNTEIYQNIQKLANGKLIALGEVSKLPDPEFFTTQPNWLWFIYTADDFNCQLKEGDFKKLFTSDKVLNLEDVIKSKKW